MMRSTPMSARSSCLLATALALGVGSAAVGQRSTDKPVKDGVAADKAATATAEKEDVSAFLARVGETIRGKDAPSRVKSFRAKVSTVVHAQGKKAKIDVAIDFLAPVYLRTEVKEGGKTYLRGRGKGIVPWMQQGDNAAYWLDGKDYATDRQSVARDLAIASGMTRFLYPDRVLAKLAELEGPIEEELRLRRDETTSAYRVQGIAKDGSDFPLAATPDFEGPLRVRAWFDRKTLALLAILLEPLQDLETRKAAGRLEELRFLDHSAKDGLLLPKKIMLRIEDRAKARMRTSQSVELISFRANPLVLSKDYFKKPE